MKALALLTFAALAACHAEPAKDANPIEVGKVRWSRDLPAALAASAKNGKPIFLLFQEVPGCAGCQQFGQDVLSDPAVVKSIEQNFIPVLIHNNKPGKDAEVLKEYNEPAWNYQVVRFLDSSGKDIIPRKDRVWTAPEIKQRISAALAKAGRPEASLAPETRRLALCQSCFWTGEMKIGALKGVARTEAGFIDGREVTMVEYDPAETSPQEIFKQAKLEGVASAAYLEDPSELPGSQELTAAYRPAPPADQKKQIQGTPFQKLDLTPEQATKVNAFARTDPAKALQYLTAEQRSQIKQ